MTITRNVRLAGINAPELRTEAGKAAKAAVETWLSTKAPLTIRTQIDRGDRYGRLLGTVTREGDVVSLSDWLIGAGLAKPYDGRGPKPI